jgi:hypothetical protein
MRQGFEDQIAAPADIALKNAANFHCYLIAYFDVMILALDDWDH